MHHTSFEAIDSPENANAIKLSAVIITFNEEDNIKRCLDSLEDVADEIVVVDAFSTDKTKQLCEKKQVRFIQNRFAGHMEQKNFAMMQASHEHILSLDADEALSPQLRASIQEVKANWNFDAYSFNRLTSYCGQWIKHCGWYPDKKIRLWHRKKGRWKGVNPHDRLIMENNSVIHHLKGDLLHYSYPSIKDNIAQINRFSDIAATAAYKKGKKAHMITDIILNPPATFMKKYIIQLGILDGFYGFVISVLSAFARFAKYVKLHDLNIQNKP
jgi:glycosyltransferase involved in cell wall biosynthesis